MLIGNRYICLALFQNVGLSFLSVLFYRYFLSVLFIGT